MKISVFTPTHRPDHLLEAHASLCKQTSKAWEWVLVPNGARFDLPAAIRDDHRVKVVEPPNDLAGIGALKRFACRACTGDVLVELDHDDILLPKALQLIRREVKAGAGFVYSDFANFREDGTCEIYDKAFGWESYAVKHGGRGYWAMRAFPLNASSLHLIFFAPNHFRAWTREAYDKAGAHDPALTVCDDFDLVCKTYLAGVKFAHIRECLYLYRLHADASNTYLQRNAEIQAKQQELSNTYIYRLIAEWCRRTGLEMYDLGGDCNSPEGFRTVNLVEPSDIVADIMDGLPFQDSTIGCIRAHDFLEHVPHCRDSKCTHEAARCTVGLMNEIYRVLVPGGWLLTATPSTDGRGAFQDPTHCSFWSVPNSFWYYSRRQQSAFVPGVKARFQLARAWNEFPTEWHKTHNILYGRADLVALKGQRQPGLVEI